MYRFLPPGFTISYHFTALFKGRELPPWAKETEVTSPYNIEEVFHLLNLSTDASMDYRTAPYCFTHCEGQENPPLVSYSYHTPSDQELGFIPLLHGLEMMGADLGKEIEKLTFTCIRHVDKTPPHPSWRDCNAFLFSQAGSGIYKGSFDTDIDGGYNRLRRWWSPPQYVTPEDERLTFKIKAENITEHNRRTYCHQLVKQIGEYTVPNDKAIHLGYILNEIYLFALYNYRPRKICINLATPKYEI